MSENATRYATIAAAEKALTDAGCRRDITRAMWVGPDGTAAKVMRDSGSGQFFISKR